ncbi:nucleotidyltransferase domain-containing protein [Marinobacterium rhizophilum]|uniref:Nucleotidyltransferase domain-containing protein n=2 Tax=Marinobacterium rhizophilum TaxID=420402 RepID=A0ABY5HSA3_9GAMM|nr:nucleotidyltransferase domain-containing protein [Marinobacterium rhizophilum]
MQAPTDHSLLPHLVQLADSAPDVAALWLYGSRARGDHGADSDYDLAVVFMDRIADRLERRLRPELLALEWQSALQLPENQLSIVDLSACPIPLGWSILSDGKLLADKTPDVRMRAESRIYSMWEIDYLYQQPSKAAVSCQL